MNIILLALLLSCSSLTVEHRKIGPCSVTNNPYGKRGRAQVVCPDLSFTLVYDNIPDGRDPLILRISGAEGKRIHFKAVDPYRVSVGGEVLEGWAFEERWELRKGERLYYLKGFEYFVNGGSSCYEEEEGYRVSLTLGGEEIPLVKFYAEETDCGGN